MPEDYVVQEGESVLSIAVPRGFLWKTIWNDGGNSALKDKRPDPDILFPGDVLHIPDKTNKQEDKPTDQQHKFKVKKQTAKFKVTLLRQPKDDTTAQSQQDAANDDWKYIEAARKESKPEPVDFVPYELMADGTQIDKGNTTKDGTIDATVPPAAKAGILVLSKGKPEERTIELHFREMAPIKEPAGVGRRLYNMGFPCSTTATEITPDIMEAVRRFRVREGLPASDTLDDATRDKIKEVYGG